MGMFEQFYKMGETVNPDNRFTFNYNDDTDVIVPGSSCEHVFEFPFIYSEVVNSCEIIYKQGIDIQARIYVNEDWVTPCPDHFGSIVKVTLTPEITSMFQNNGLNVFAQAKIYTKNDEEILYDEPHRIYVKEPLDSSDTGLYSVTYSLKIDETKCKVYIRDEISDTYIYEGSCSIIKDHMYELKEIEREPGYDLTELKFNGEDILNKLTYHFKGSENVKIIAKAEKEEISDEK